MMNECVEATSPEEDTLEQVKNAVYCWVLVNQPDIIRYAKELVAG